MSEWNAMTYEAKDTMLRVVQPRRTSMFAMAESPGPGRRRRRAAKWQVRDIIGHLVDTTEAYFEAFDAARGGGEAGDAYGLPGMAERVNTQAQSVLRRRHRESCWSGCAPTTEDHGDARGLTEEEWGGLMVPHFYMGPLPAFFYPAFQLMDYGVHSWDIRQGLGRAHGLAGDAADLLVPFMFVLWQSRPPPRAASRASGRAGHVRRERRQLVVGSDRMGSPTRVATSTACRWSSSSTRRASC